VPSLFEQMELGYHARIRAEQAIENILGIELLGIGFDDYDRSFEIFPEQAGEDVAPTKEQHDAIIALGCRHYWINFPDGSERYCRGERKPAAGTGNRWTNFDLGGNQERRATPRQGADALDARSQAAIDVLAERKRQISVEGWTPEHDDEHSNGEIARAAAAYAYPELTAIESVCVWPWGPDWWKPKDERRNLVRAGALILAEIERLDRLPKPWATCANCKTPEFCRGRLRGCDIAESLESGIAPLASQENDRHD